MSHMSSLYIDIASHQVDNIYKGIIKSWSEFLSHMSTSKIESTSYQVDDRGKAMVKYSPKPLILLTYSLTTL